MIASIAGYDVASGRTARRRPHPQRARTACPRCTSSLAETVSARPGRATHGLRRPLDALVSNDDTPLAVPARVTAAARAFSAGNGYLTGLLVDRTA